MSATLTPSELAKERDTLIGNDALLSELIRQRGEMKLCFDDEDGWFVQFCWHHQREAWMTLSCDEGRSVSPTVAIRDAMKAHNEDVERQRLSGRCEIHQHIPDNAGAVAPPPQMPDSTSDVPGGCPPASC